MDGGGVMMARQTVDQSQLFSVLRIHSTASNTRRVGIGLRIRDVLFRQLGGVASPCVMKPVVTSLDG